LAFGLAWLPFSPALFGEEAVPVLMPFAPAIAASVVRKWVTREGFGDAGLRPNLRRWRFYLVAIGWPLLTIPLSVAIASALRLGPDSLAIPWGMAAPSIPKLLFWLVVPLLMAPVIFGEEFGWRGYLQIRLLAHRPLLAAIVTGLIWASWHIPLILVGSQPTESRLITLLAFPVFGVTMSIFLGWLRARTSETWAPSVGHATNNGFEDPWSRFVFTGDRAGDLPTFATVPLLLAEAIVLLGIVAVDALRRGLRPRRSVPTTVPPDGARPAHGSS
jgi:membrane protease YdiL (CAAX protease family)